MGIKKISTIILTHNRPEMIHQAVESVLQQDYQGEQEILVGTDDCSYDQELQRAYPQPNVSILPQNPNNNDISAKLAEMRNNLVERATGSYISFLDDDNYYRRDHLSTLAKALRKEDAGAAYSSRVLIEEDGSPYIPHEFPWGEGDAAKEEYEYYKEQNVFFEDSPILNDQAQLDNGDTGMVDTSAWLFKLNTIEQYPFPESRQKKQKENTITEDDLLLRTLIENNVQTVSTDLPTLYYRLGGYSNS